MALLDRDGLYGAPRVFTWPQKVRHQGAYRCRNYRQCPTFKDQSSKTTKAQSSKFKAQSSKADVGHGLWTLDNNLQLSPFRLVRNRLGYQNLAG